MLCGGSLALRRARSLAAVVAAAVAAVMARTGAPAALIAAALGPALALAVSVFLPPAPRRTILEPEPAAATL